MSRTTIQLFTYRQGLAARLGHDLRLSTAAVQLTLADGLVRAVIALASLQVDGAMRRGALDPAAIDALDRHAIAKSLQREVLDVEHHPEARYEGRVRVEGERVAVQGTLSLAGRTLPLALALTRRGAEVSGEVELQPSRWGIKPFKALGGVLKVEDRVRVRIELHLDAEAGWPPVTLP